MSRLPAPTNSHPRTVRPVGDDPARVAGLLVAAWTEVRRGERPLAQLGPLVSPAARCRLLAQLPAPRTARPGPTRVRKVITRHPDSQVCEAVVLVETGRRVTAMAVRLERHLGRWRAVELTAPEAGLTALPTSSLPSGYRRRDAFDEVEEGQQRAAADG